MVFLPNKIESSPELDAIVEQMTSLPGLRWLFIKADVSDSGLKTIGTMTQLERLCLQSWVITDAGCVHLANLTRLKGLELFGSQLTDETIAALSVLPRLESLALHGRQMTNDGLVHLRRLPALRGLTLHGRNTTGAGGTQINGNALRIIAELTNLENVSLDGVIVSDADLDHLARLKKLKSASFFMTGASEAAMAKLQEALPQATLMAGGGGTMTWPPATSIGGKGVPGAFTVGPTVVVPGAAGY